MADTLYRATLEIAETAGRTLAGFVWSWDRATRVRDLTGPAYLEAFAPASCDVSIRQGGARPVFVRHDTRQDPIGTVTFERSAEGLLFVAPLSKTARADEMLELVNDGAMRSVSGGFRPLQHVQRSSAGGMVTVRTEVALRELSLAPTGYGQYDDAKVLAVRSEGAGTPVMDALRRRASRIALTASPQ